MSKNPTRRGPARRSSTKRRQVKNPPILFEKTQRIVRKIQAIVEGTFITYWNSESGAICGNDVQAMYEALQTVRPKEKITFFVKSDGGDGTSSLRIIHLLREYAKKLIVVAPLECASAATMLALGADAVSIGQGVLVGHLLECAAQVSGGYIADPGHFDVPDLHDLGFPLADDRHVRLRRAIDVEED